MLTADKVYIYKEYKGFYDGYYMENRDSLNQAITGNDWSLLDNFVQDIFLIRKKLVAISFEKNVHKKLRDHCDSEITIKLVIELEEFINH